MCKNCRKLPKITFFNFLQISDILASVMIPIPLEMAKNTFKGLNTDLSGILKVTFGSFEFTVLLPRFYFTKYCRNDK